MARLAGATALATAGIAYGWLWTTHTLRGYDALSDRLGLADNALAERVVELGFDIEYEPSSRGVRVTEVRAGTPAEAAGLRAGDLVVAVDGRSVHDSAAALGDVYLERRPGDAVGLGVLRAGEGAPVEHRAVFRARSLPTSLPALVRVLLGTTVLFPFVLLAVALPVLFYRLEDRNAWLLALLFLCLTAAPGFPNGFAGLDGGWLWFARAYRSVLGGLLGASFFGLFAVFPDRSPLERRAPWLKWILLGVGLVLGLSGVREGGAAAPAAVEAWLGREAARGLGFAYSYGAIALGLASLLASAWRPPTPDARRKIHVVAWGTAVGVLPAVTLELVQELGGQIPDWLMALGFVAVFVLPLSFAYAVVRHRVLELPVLLKRSARYVLVRRGFGFLLVLLALAANALFALSLELAARIRTVSSQAELGELLGEQLRRALQPTSIATYFGSPDGRLRAAGVPAELASLPREAPGLAEVAREGRPREFTRDDGQPLVPSLLPLAPDCLVPCVVHGELVGLVVLGPRLSEEPYSGEDGRLLSTVAAQAAVALDNLALAARMAERIEAERRAAHEMELARRVQGQLLPREGRRLERLECEGRCVQARAVGGDYFDFIEGGDGRLGLVLADVSGKGFAAALLMASLQASLRTLWTRGEDLRERLRAVNRLLVESSEPSRYATLFLAEYEDASGRLRFVNCGHNPPLLLRADGPVERLQPTAMVIGLVEPWACEVGEVVLRPGDVLVAYSDGISEATDEGDREFGDERLLETVAAFRAGPLAALLDAVFDAVRRFGGSSQADDQTLLVARARPEGGP
jgi:sigma-B regulation protein RsbU (phosphoserine phosphatase)